VRFGGLSFRASRIRAREHLGASTRADRARHGLPTGHSAPGDVAYGDLPNRSPTSETSAGGRPSGEGAKNTRRMAKWKSRSAVLCEMMYRGPVLAFVLAGCALDCGGSPSTGPDVGGSSGTSSPDASGSGSASNASTESGASSAEASGAISFSPDSGSAAAAFVGTFQATWVSTATITSPVGIPAQSYTDTAVITVTARDSNDILMAWQVGSNAPSGTIVFAVNGDSATATGIGTGGTCWMGQLTNGNQQTSCALTATAAIMGDTLTQHQTGTAKGVTPAGVPYTAIYEGTWTGLRIAGGSSGATAASAFVGTWNGSVNGSVTCPSGVYPSTGNSTETVTAGTAAGAIATFGGYCRLNWTANTASMASLSGSQVCPTVSSASAGSWTPTYTGGTITLQGTTAVIAETGTGVRTSTLLPSGSEACTFTDSGSYVKSN
jgi:hypothetical protein